MVCLTGSRYPVWAVTLARFPVLHRDVAIVVENKRILQLLIHIAVNYIEIPVAANQKCVTSDTPTCQAVSSRRHRGDDERPANAGSGRGDAYGDP